MDRTSVKVLKFIRKQAVPVSADVIVAKFGTPGEQSLSRLCEGKYISQGIAKTWLYHNGATGTSETKAVHNAMYTIEPLGRDFLEHKFWDDFDKWLVRLCAIWGAITGTIALFG